MYLCGILRYTDMESEDYPFFQGLVYLLENDVSTLGYELTFSTEVCVRVSQYSNFFYALNKCYIVSSTVEIGICFSGLEFHVFL